MELVSAVVCLYSKSKPWASQAFWKAAKSVIFGAPENLLDKLTRLEAVLTRTDADTLTLINVSTPEIGYN